MKKNLQSFVMLLVMLVPATLFGQQKKRCGTTEYMAKMRAENPAVGAQMQLNEQQLQQWMHQNQDMRTTNTVVTVPVVFHVLYHNSFQNISTNRIMDQLAVLNADYAELNADTTNIPGPFKPLAANTNIQFCLAQRDPNGNATSGIIRVSVAATGFDPISNQNAKYTANGGDDAWPRASYLNVWICNFNGSSNSLLGISQFPGGLAATDGCCVLYSTVGGPLYPGTEPGYSHGRTLTHEVGHWFALHHVWGDDDNQNGVCEAPSECAGTDYVNDTPNQGEENYGCPSFPLIDCCSSTSTGDPVNGVMFMDYMDYVDDNCMNMFTAGQAARMYSTFSISSMRGTLLTSNGCVVPNAVNDLNAMNLDLAVFPNPSNGDITVSGQLIRNSDLSVTITNLIGEVVYNTELKNVLDLNLAIDLSGKAKGIYNLVARSKDAVVNRKVVLR